MADLVARCEVYVNDELLPPADASWTLQPHLEAQSLLRGVSTTLDTATLRWRFGRMDREADLPSGAAVDGSLDWRDPLLLVGKFVRLVSVDLDVDWFGYVLVEAKSRGPQVDIPDGLGGTIEAVAIGDQLFTAVGLEWFLQCQTVNFSIVEDAAGGGLLRVERAIPFNGGFGDGRSVDYAARENREPGELRFAVGPDSATAWSAAAALEYLLLYHGPADDGGALAPIEFALDATAVPFLSWFRPTLETEGRSVWQVVNDLVSPARGLVWWLACEVVGPALVAKVFVDSMATADVAMPDGGTLPEAASQYGDPSFDAMALIGGPVITRDLGRTFHRVIARGARRRAVFTVSAQSGNLEPSWRPEDETAYRTGVGSVGPTNDRFRQSGRFERVYQCFQIPPTWDGKCNDGSGVPAGSEFACPTLPQGSTSIVGASTLHMPGLRLLRTMPTRVGWDYVDATNPTPRDPDEAASEFQRPFAVFDVADSVGSRWRISEELSTTDEAAGASTKTTSFSVTPLESVAGLQLKPGGGMPHALALNHFLPETDGATTHQPEVDWATMRCTVAGEWDAYCDGAWPAAAPTAAPLRTLYVHCGDRYRLDWLAAGTIYDVEGDALMTVATGGPLRDDRNRLVEIARLAYEWYGVERAQLEFVVAGAPAVGYGLGALITSIGSGAQLEAINATVSQLDYDFEAGAVRVSCGYSELNFEAL